MKLLWCLVLFGVASASLDLEHFKIDELSQSFKEYQLTIPESCDSDINGCMAELHTTARACVGHWKEHSGKYIDQCLEDAELKQMAKKWQEASFHWHKCMDDCLDGEEPPAEASSSTVFLAFLKRKKRSSHSGHGHHSHGGETFDDSCFQHVEEKIAACNAKAMECPALAKCWGMGDAPSADNANDATWFEHIKELRAAAKSSKEEFKAKMMACIAKKRADDMNSMLKNSDMASLSSHFRLFNFSSSTCNPDLWECVASLHERALMCARLQQTENERSEKYEECTANEDIKQARKDWEIASGDWHKALDMCMAGEEVPEEEDANTIFYFLLRRKRSTGSQHLGPDHPHAHASRIHSRGHGPRVFVNAAECWKDVAAHRRDCCKKAKECPEYAICSAAKGVEVAEDKRAWYDRSKELKERQEQTLADYEKKLHDCLGTPEPAEAMKMNAEHEMHERW